MGAMVHVRVPSKYYKSANWKLDTRQVDDQKRIMIYGTDIKRPIENTKNGRSHIFRKEQENRQTVVKSIS